MRASGRKMRPSTRSSVKTGMRAAMMIAIANRVGRDTSSAERVTRPSRAERSCGLLSSMARRTFSTSTTAPSTRIPKSIAPIEMRFAGSFRIDSPMKAVRSASGMIAVTMSEQRRLRRNSQMTAPTKSAPKIRLWCTVARVRSTSVVRS